MATVSSYTCRYQCYTCTDVMNTHVYAHMPMPGRHAESPMTCKGTCNARAGGGGKLPAACPGTPRPACCANAATPRLTGPGRGYEPRHALTLFPTSAIRQPRSCGRRCGPEAPPLIRGWAVPPSRVCVRAPHIRLHGAVRRGRIQSSILLNSV